MLVVFLVAGGVAILLSGAWLVLGGAVNAAEAGGGGSFVPGSGERMFC